MQVYNMFIHYKKIACINFIIILVIIISSKCMHKINCPSSTLDDNFCFNTTDLLSERAGCSNSLSTDRRRNSLNEVASYSGVIEESHTLHTRLRFRASIIIDRVRAHAHQRDAATPPMDQVKYQV